MIAIRQNLTNLVFKSKFHTTSTQLFKVGETIKGNLPGLVEDSPGSPVDLKKEVENLSKTIIVQVPGAFSPACSASHVPGYVANLQKFKEKGINKIFITTVNDSFVTKAWKEDLKLPADGSVRLFADSEAAFAESGDSLFEDSVKFFGNKRGTRTALVVENGKITQVFEEPDKAGVAVSSAENVLKHL